MEQDAQRLFRELWRIDSGQDLIEYALVAALIGLASIACDHDLKQRTLATASTASGNALTNAI